MAPDGTYRKKKAGEKQIDAQAVFMKEALNARRPPSHPSQKERGGLLVK